MTKKPKAKKPKKVAPGKKRLEQAADFGMVPPKGKKKKTGSKPTAQDKR